MRFLRLSSCDRWWQRHERSSRSDQTLSQKANGCGHSIVVLVVVVLVVLVVIVVIFGGGGALFDHDEVRHRCRSAPNYLVAAPQRWLWSPVALLSAISRGIPSIFFRSRSDLSLSWPSAGWASWLLMRPPELSWSLLLFWESWSMMGFWASWLLTRLSELSCSLSPSGATGASWSQRPWLGPGLWSNRRSPNCRRCCNRSIGLRTSVPLRRHRRGPQQHVDVRETELSLLFLSF